MPPSLERRTQRTGRLLWILRYVVLLAYVMYGLRAVTIQKGAPFRSAIVGLVVGAALVQVRLLLITVWPNLGFANAAHPALLGPVGVWSAIIVLGGISEELWRAFCLVSLRQGGSNIEAEILATSGAFALAELCGRPSRISSQREEIAFTFMVGVFLAALFLTFHSLSMIICANIAYSGLSFYRLRRDEGLAISKLQQDNP
jgi:Type II CAAX prenyl endopeptidase Rce1-like